MQDGSNNLMSFCHKHQFGAGVLQNPSANLPRLEGCKTPWSSILCWLAEIPANLYYLAEPLSSKNGYRFPAANKFADLASLGKPDLRAEQQCLRGYPARPFCAVGLLRDLRVLPNNIGGMKSDFPQHPRRNTPVVARVASTQYERPPRQYGAASRPWTRKQRPPQMARGSQPAARCPVSYPRLTVQPSGYLSGAQEAVGDGAHHQRGAGAGVARHVHGS